MLWQNLKKLSKLLGRQGAAVKRRKENTDPRSQDTEEAAGAGAGGMNVQKP